MSLSISNSKKFTIKVLVGAIICLVVYGIASEWLLRTHILPKDRFFQQVELFHSNMEAAILFAGDSHMSQGVDAPIGTLNIGLAGDSFEQIVTKLNLYLKTHNKPDQIILQLSPQMFASYRFDGQFRDYDFYFNPKFHKDNFIAIFDPFYKVRIYSYWKKYLKNGQINPRSNLTRQGSQLIDFEMNSDITKSQSLLIKKRVDQHSFEKEPLNYPTSNLMMQIIGELQDANIGLCIVTFPVTPAYREQASKNESFKKAIKFFEKITADYGVPYLNYYSAINDYSLFRNMDHLNKAGAQQLTPRLINECNAAL